MSKAIGICKYCGKEFNQPKWSDGRYSNKLYCSDECCNANYRENISTNKHTSKCKYCGKEFKQTLKENGKYTSYTYCSEECQKQNYIETHPTANSVLREKLLQGKIKPEQRICSVCGEKFTPSVSEKGWVSTSTICSLECERQKYVNENPDSVAAKKRKSKCEVCGKVFDSPITPDGIYYTVKYCSEECRKSINKHIEKERICKQCGKTYIQINEEGSREFCSEECKLQFRHNRQFGICKQCGKTFEQTKKKDGSYSTREFCSNECVSAHWTYYRKCKNCGKEFKLVNYTDGRVDERACCCKGCEESGWELKADYRILKCAYCGKEFKRYRKPKTGQFSGSIPLYCSTECRKKGQIRTVTRLYGEDFYKRLSEAGGQAVSKTNEKFAQLLKENNIEFEQEYNIDNYLFDFYIPSVNKVIEINPTYTHTVEGNHFNNYQYNEKYETYHLSKTMAAMRKGIECIHVWQWDKWSSIIDIIKPKTVLYARKLKIREITKQEANKFVELYHLQGSCYGNSVNLGLFDNDKLVQVMTFGKPRYNKNYEYELLRLCSHSDYAIVGGAERLFKYFIRNYNPQSIISYCDSAKFNGNIYLKLGFKFKNASKAQKNWSKGHEYITDNLLRQHGYDRLFNANYGKGTNNEQLMLEHGWLPVYDCGQKIYTYSVEDTTDGQHK